MKVILLEDVKGVGKKEQLIEASEGHARNFLIPRKLAVEATKENIQKLESKKKKEEKQRIDELEAARALKAKLEEISIKIEVKTGDNGKIFGSVTSKEISEAFDQQLSIKIDKKKVILPEPIKIKGKKTVDYKIHSDVTVKLNVEIV